MTQSILSLAEHRSLALEILHARYEAIETSFREQCRDDPICSLELKRRVSESIFRAYLLKDSDFRTTIRAFKDFVACNYSENITILWFALTLRAECTIDSHISYLSKIIDDYQKLVADEVFFLTGDLRKIKRRVKGGFD